MTQTQKKAALTLFRNVERKAKLLADAIYGASSLVLPKNKNVFDFMMTKKNDSC